jgi:hypothetical protein
VTIIEKPAYEIPIQLGVIDEFITGKKDTKY